MTEDEAIGWVAQRLPELVVRRLEAFAASVIQENEHQNLISPASIPNIWSRHIVDSLQLLDLAPDAGTWIDIGTGGGFPGLVIAIAREQPMLLVEPRRRRAEFLTDSAHGLGLRHVTVSASKVEAVGCQAAVISARAVASVEKLLHAARHCATPATCWLLPRGSVDVAELDLAARQHGMMFHVEQSVTHPQSAIVVMRAK